MEVKNIGTPQTGRLQMFGFKYTSWTVTFVDGTKGTLCQDEQNSRYFVDTLTSRAYYRDRDSCLKALYFWANGKGLISDGKL